MDSRVTVKDEDKVFSCDELRHCRVFLQEIWQYGAKAWASLVFWSLLDFPDHQGLVLSGRVHELGIRSQGADPDLVLEEADWSVCHHGVDVPGKDSAVAVTSDRGGSVENGNGLDSVSVSSDGLGWLQVVLRHIENVDVRVVTDNVHFLVDTAENGSELLLLDIIGVALFIEVVDR